MTKPTPKKSHLKRPTLDKPAPTIAIHDETRAIEKAARENFHYKKVLIQEGPIAALDLLRQAIIEGDDPENASLTANVYVSRINGWVTRDAATQGRRSKRREEDRRTEEGRCPRNSRSYPSIRDADAGSWDSSPANRGAHS